MGGPAESDESLAGRWAEASYTMKSQRGKLTIPIGLLSHVGLRRHRALLFKVVADCLGIPSRLVRGRYYCGSEVGPSTRVPFSVQRKPLYP